MIRWVYETPRETDIAHHVEAPRSAEDSEKNVVRVVQDS